MATCGYISGAGTALRLVRPTWVNDVAVGMNEGGFTPFEFRIDDLLEFDRENTLMLRVVGPILMQDNTIDGMEKWKPCNGEALSRAACGSPSGWQRDGGGSA